MRMTTSTIQQHAKAILDEIQFQAGYRWNNLRIELRDHGGELACIALSAFSVILSSVALYLSLTAA